MRNKATEQKKIKQTKQCDWNLTLTKGAYLPEKSFQWQEVVHRLPMHLSTYQTFHHQQIHRQCQQLLGTHSLEPGSESYEQNCEKEKEKNR